MAVRDLVVIGASAGGVEALRTLVAGLPPDLPAAVLVVLHLPRDAPSALPGILRRAGRLPVSHGRDGEILRAGRIYVAPINQHLLVADGGIVLSQGPAENGHRPAIDPLFRSAARTAGPRTVGVVLSGNGDDGSAGLAEIAARGGVTVVQDPGEAIYDSMPRSALRYVDVDHVVPISEMGAAIGQLAGSAAPDAVAPPSPLLIAETEMAEMKPLTSDLLPGQPSGLACPSCHGALFELAGEPGPRLRCRVGHAWSPETLLNEQSAALEGALWMALRSLEEKSALARRMAVGARQRGSLLSASQYERSAADAATASRLIRDLILRVGPTLGEPPAALEDAEPADHA